MSDKLIAVGAEWCTFSRRQQQAIEGMAEGTSNVHMVMCQDANRQPITHTVAWKNEVCTGTADTIRGYPTWFKQDTAGAVTQLKEDGNGMHFMESNEICTRLGNAGEECKE